jgi:hypothetical protein
MTKPYKPTWLYIKEHEITGLRYFGKTTQNPQKYKGSGVDWTKHLLEHGPHVKTIWTCLFETDAEIRDFARFFSDEFDIVNSDNWANAVPESGHAGGAVKGHKAWNKGLTRDDPRIAKSLAAMTQATKGKPGKKGGTPWNKGKTGVQDAWNKGLAKEQQPMFGKVNSGRAGKPGPNTGNFGNTPWNKGMKFEPQPKVTCPHCNKQGSGPFKAYHFEKCKALRQSELDE